MTLAGDDGATAIEKLRTTGLLTENPGAEGGWRLGINL